MKSAVWSLMFFLVILFVSGCTGGDDGSGGNPTDSDQVVTDGDNVDGDAPSDGDDNESDGDVVDGDATDGDVEPDGDDIDDDTDPDGEMDVDENLTDGDIESDGDFVDGDIIDGDFEPDDDTDLPDGDMDPDGDADLDPEPESDDEQCPEMWEGPAPPDCQQWDCVLEAWPTCWVCNLVADTSQNGLSCSYCEGDCECTEPPCVCLDGACINDPIIDGDVDDDWDSEIEQDTADWDMGDGDIFDGDIVEGDMVDGDADGDFDEENESPNVGYYYPPVAPLDDTWETVTPVSLGWDELKLAEALEYVEDHSSTGFLILHKGRIVVEEYWEGWDLHTSDKIFSAGKSVIAVLTGFAVQEDLLAVSDVVYDWIGRWSFLVLLEREKRITVRHLLTMTSGLSSALTYQGDPGTIWNYNTPAFKNLRDVLEAVSGQDINAFTQSRLYGPIGMRESNWSDTTYMDASARDMARFGLLVLSDGAWDGTPILTDQTYFQAMLDTSQDLNPAYGYLWWLNGKESYLIPSEEDTPGVGHIIQNGPRDLVAALGTGDKKIYIVPSLDLVVVRHGGDTGTPQLALSSFDNELWRLLLLAIPE